MKLASYDISCDGLNAKVEIKRISGEYVPIYKISLPFIEEGTLAAMNEIKEKLTSQIQIKTSYNPQGYEELVNQFKEKAKILLGKYLKETDEKIKGYLAFTIVSEMLGLGRIEILLRDSLLEEIVINNSKEPIWVYHKHFGWLKTNMIISDESQIENYARMIGRRVGRTINILNPLMDAHLMTGDRVNATLFPISTKGNTLTIRLFRRKPFTIPDLIKNGTVNYETAALIWEAIQYEISIIVSGGTASGKTTFLNAILSFIPPNQRIISIEDTRELNLPKFLHWVPLTTREPNPEGKGTVSMLDLLVNSLRMRPDRIVIGEIRRQREAEVLFEALHTGHSVYGTLHANTTEETIRRMTSPPINLPKEEVEDLPMVLVMYRHRRLGIRRLFQVGEIIRGKNPNIVYQWEPKDDKIKKIEELKRINGIMKLFTGMSDEEIKKDIEGKIKVLKEMVKKNISGLEEVGKRINKYYVEGK